MPITITNISTDQEVAWLCDDQWDLQNQIHALSEWIDSKSGAMTPGTFAADIGFSPRPNATGGGVGFSPETLGSMSRLGMALFLSEYPEFSNEE